LPVDDVRWRWPGLRILGTLYRNRHLSADEVEQLITPRLHVSLETRAVCLQSIGIPVELRANGPLLPEGMDWGSPVFWIPPPDARPEDVPIPTQRSISGDTRFAVAQLHASPCVFHSFSSSCLQRYPLWLTPDQAGSVNRACIFAVDVLDKTASPPVTICTLRRVLRLSTRVETATLSDTAVQLTTAEELAEAVRSSLSVWIGPPPRKMDLPDGTLYLRVEASKPPVDLSFDVQVRSGDKLVDKSSFVAPAASLRRGRAMSFQIPCPPQKLDVILRPNPIHIFFEISRSAVWGGTIEFKDVPVSSEPARDF
jgi:hypothetical protein